MTKQSDILTDDQLRQLIQTEINALNNTPATTGVQAEFCDKCGWAIDEDNNNHKADAAL